VIARRLEIDSSLGALDFVAQTDWVSIHPGIAIMREIESGHLIVNPLAAPAPRLELFRIERARTLPSPGAVAFLAALEVETQALQRRADSLVAAPVSG